MTVLVDSQVSDGCPWATCYFRYKGLLTQTNKEHNVIVNVINLVTGQFADFLQ